jgi:hypothetical protein
VGSASSGEKAIEANPDEASREDVQEEAPQEFVGRDGHESLPTAVGVILPAKGDAVLGDVDEPMIGNRDAVRVAREVVQYVRGSPEGRFGVDDPVLAKEGAEEGAKRLVGRQRLELARKYELVASKGFF